MRCPATSGAHTGCPGHQTRIRALRTAHQGGQHQQPPFAALKPTPRVPGSPARPPYPPMLSKTTPLSLPCLPRGTTVEGAEKLFSKMNSVSMDHCKATLLWQLRRSVGLVTFAGNADLVLDGSSSPPAPPAVQTLAGARDWLVLPPR